MSAGTRPARTVSFSVTARRAARVQSAASGWWSQRMAGSAPEGAVGRESEGRPQPARSGRRAATTAARMPRDSPPSSSFSPGWACRFATCHPWNGFDPMALTPPAARLATLAAAPARVLAAGIGGALRRPEAAQVPAMRPLRERLQVPVLARAPETEECLKLVAAHAALAAEDRWAELLAVIARADRARAAAPGGARVATLASAGARAALTQAIAREDWAGAATEVARLEAVAAAHSDDPFAAQILAQAHLDLGWARRGAVAATSGTSQGWRDFLAHTAAADAILDRFDPIECDSPLLAGTRYRLLRGSRTGKRCSATGTRTGPTWTRPVPNPMPARRPPAARLVRLFRRLRGRGACRPGPRGTPVRPRPPMRSSTWPGPRRWAIRRR